MRTAPAAVKLAQKEVPTVAFSPFIELRERKPMALSRQLKTISTSIVIVNARARKQTYRCQSLVW